MSEIGQRRRERETAAREAGDTSLGGSGRATTRTYRNLVAEYTSPLVAELLREEHDAAHCPVDFERGVTDRRIRTDVMEHGYVVLTHDDDVLRPEDSQTVSGIYYSDDTLVNREITDLVLEVVRYGPTRATVHRSRGPDDWQ